jgi:threonine dehydratase
MRAALHGEAPPLPGMAQTVAEGIAVKQPGAVTTPIVRALVKDILIAREADIEHALALILEIEKTLVEGAATCSCASWRGKGVFSR